MQSTSQGLIQQHHDSNIITATPRGYFFGNSRSDEGNHRNYFTFELPSSLRNSMVARLLMATKNPQTNQINEIVYSVCSTFQTDILADLLTATLIEARKYTAADRRLTLEISLNSNVLLDLSESFNSAFTIDRYVTSPTPLCTNQPDQYSLAPFVGNQVEKRVQLGVTCEENQVPVPSTETIMVSSTSNNDLTVRRPVRLQKEKGKI